MSGDDEILTTRLDNLECALRHTRLFSAMLALCLLVTWLTGAQRSPVVQDTVRTRLLVIEDSAGRQRIVLGAPMPDGRQYVGMKILDPGGAEQFGLGLKTDGSVSMGFDTKPGVGNPANRERLNMGVTSAGRPWIRFLDNDTRAKLFIMADSADNAVIQFLHWPGDNRIVVKQHDFSGEKQFEWKR